MTRLVEQHFYGLQRCLLVVLITSFALAFALAIFGRRSRWFSLYTGKDVLLALAAIIEQGSCFANGRSITARGRRA